MLFQDNSHSPKALSGVQSLFNVKQNLGYDAFDPDDQGGSAGLNFEHIISGHNNTDNRFTPRSGLYTLHSLNDRSVELRRRKEDARGPSPARCGIL